MIEMLQTCMFAVLLGSSTSCELIGYLELESHIAMLTGVLLDRAAAGESIDMYPGCQVGPCTITSHEGGKDADGEG